MPSVIVNAVIAAFMPLNLSATTLRLKFVFVFFLTGKAVPLRWFQRELSRKKRPDDVKSQNSTPLLLSMLKLHTSTASQYFDSTWFDLQCCGAKGNENTGRQNVAGQQRTQNMLLFRWTINQSEISVSGTDEAPTDHPPSSEEAWGSVTVNGRFLTKARR